MESLQHNRTMQTRKAKLRSTKSLQANSAHQHPLEGTYCWNTHEASSPDQRTTGQICGSDVQTPERVIYAVQHIPHALHITILFNSLWSVTYVDWYSTYVTVPMTVLISIHTYSLVIYLSSYLRTGSLQFVIAQLKWVFTLHVLLFSAYLHRL